ncbi:hypothetical protein CMV_019901 [Castanea mollissima]|uniref:non-specific serine/threonine protein kinase n=1 Tax=Castanea mollissima TaxID=60419 RepID=A0A8J4QRI4_9ROSI|nr:hypothetical protein CMV_019901 [Castanea mollissima]
MSLPSVKASMITFVFLSLLTSFHSKISEAASASRAYSCPKEPNFTPNSTYQSNLNHLLSSLSSNANLETGFYNTTVGHNPPNIVYGLFLCRGDVTPNVCQDCVSTATKDIVQHYCPTGIEATIWYDQCMLRYSNESFFSSMIDWPRSYSCNDSKITVLDRFDQILGTMINDSVTQATGAHDEPGATKFATKEASLSSSIKLYCLVQCTPDISSYDCDKCLRGLIANIPFSCSGKQGAIALTPNCNFRYEAYQFYRNLAMPPPRSGKNRISSLTIIAIVTPIAVSMVLLAMVYCLLRMSARKKSPMEEENESLLFDLATIKAATNKFSEDNKLGKGGFGEVYKGTLSNGQEIAAKMLSKNSTQGEEKILVYEYVPNKSLDYFLNDPKKQRILNWSMRYKIIGGIARGILYLHEDSRLRIIHRDLKVSNILLDENMNPKISDFGLARIFGNDQTLENTHKIAGTYGYMPTEYAMYGQFSIKTDIFSFGILLLEILCGKKNTSFYTSDATENLLSYAWKHWKGGTSLELLDPTIRDSYSEIEVNRFFLQSRAQTNMPESESDQSTRKSILLSVDEASITEVYPR